MRTSLISSIVGNAADRSSRRLHLSLRCFRQQGTAPATVQAVQSIAGSKRRSCGLSATVKWHRPHLSNASFISRSTTEHINNRYRTAHNRDLSTQSENSSKDPKEETQSFLESTLRYPPAISNGIISALLSNGIPPSSLLSMVKSLAGRYEVGEDGGLVALAASVKKELEEKEGKARVKIWCLPSVGWSAADADVCDDNDNENLGIDGGVKLNGYCWSQLPKIHSMERAFAIEAYEGTTLADLINFGADASASAVDARVREKSNEGDLEIDAAVDDNIANANVLGEYLECACSGIMACSTCHVVVHPDWFDFDSHNGNDISMQQHHRGRNCDTIKNNINTDHTNTNKNTSIRAKIGPPSEAEQDMIDLAFQPQLTSRLGCQIVLTKELDGLILLLPKESHNLMDFVPFDG